MKKLKAFWIKSDNVGNTLTPIIVEHFTDYKLIHVSAEEQRKLIAIGSTMTSMRTSDTIWGTGIMRNTDKFPHVADCRFLAVRGKLTEKILDMNVGVYGDPALLLSRMYSPSNTKKYKLGIIPHYIEQDEPIFKELAKKDNSKVINTFLNWKTFIDEVVSCEEIISSSLHGIIIAEAYGIPATWIKPTDKVAGNGFKFRDYLTGTNRDGRGEGLFPPIPNLREIQDGLLTALKNV